MGYSRDIVGTHRSNWPTLLTHERVRPSRTQTDTDTRNMFEQDYHRIIMSASFRRLQDKTQVFPLDRSDFVRTRLTHSLEVSSLSRSLGQIVAQEISFRSLDPTLTPQLVTELCDLLLAAGLIHDIGNPPFGHYGETTIRDWFRAHLSELLWEGRPLTEVLSEQMQADLYNWEGNAQALRLLCKLHFLVDWHGMNLTLPLLNTLIKYPVRSTEIDRSAGDIKYHKMGYFFAEEDLYARIGSSCGTCGRRHPATYLLEAADDISYRTADIEDAYRKGHFTYAELRSALDREQGRVCSSREDEGSYVRQLERLDLLLARGQKEQVNKPELFAIQNWIVAMQKELLGHAATSFCNHYDAIMDGEHREELLAGTPGEPLIRALGNIASDYVFNSRRIIQLEVATNTIIGGLLDKFVPAVLEWGTGQAQSSLEPRLISMISDNYRSSYEVYSEGKDEVTRLYLRLLLVTDYIAGMTDSFAKTLYQSINGMDNK